jgi:hypothetical protein
MKIVYIILTLIFGAFAFFQYNDPDWYIWMILYGFVALMSFLAIYNRFNNAVLIPAMIVFILYFIYLVPSIFEWMQSGQSIDAMSDDRPYVEGTREAFGLLLSLGALFFIYKSGQKKPHHHR